MVAESAIAAAAADLRRNSAKFLIRTGKPASRDPVVCSFSVDGTAAVRIVDAGGRVDLNMAPVPLLQALFAGLGLAGDTANKAAADVEAYRTAKTAALAPLKGKIDPLPLPFDTEEAIAQVQGITPDLARDMAPFVTVYSGARGVDSLEADPRLLSLLQTGGGTDSASAGSSRQTFIISVAARGSAGGLYGEEATVRLSREVKFPMGVEVKSWRPAVFDADLMPGRGDQGELCTKDGLFAPS